MSFFKRLFSSATRQARAAEADGRLEDAARLYAEADELDHVARIHRVRADIERDPWSRIEILRIAASFTDAERDETTHRSIRRALAEALEAWVTDAGIMDRRDKALLEEAARLFEDIGDLEACGDVYARMGYHNKAAGAWTQAGAVEKLEGAHLMEEVTSADRQQRHRLIDDFRIAEETGLLLEAKDAIGKALDTNPDDPAIRDLHRRFMARLPGSGRIRLEIEGGDDALVLLGDKELTCGRDEHATLTLLAPGVSRLHTRIWRQGGEIVVQDLQSKNGTFVDGKDVRVDPVPIANAGVLALGDRCDLGYRVIDDSLVLEPRTSFGGRTVYVWANRVAIPRDTFPVPVEVALIRGYWHLVPSRGQQVDGFGHVEPVMLRVDARITTPDDVDIIVRP